MKEYIYIFFFSKVSSLNISLKPFFYALFLQILETIVSTILSFGLFWT